MVTRGRGVCHLSRVTNAPSPRHAVPSSRPIGFSVTSQLSNATYMIFGYDDEGGLYQRAAIALPSGLGVTRAFLIGEYLYIVNNDRWGVFYLENPGEVEWKRV